LAGVEVACSPGDKIRRGSPFPVSRDIVNEDSSEQGTRDNW